MRKLLPTIITFFLVAGGCVNRHTTTPQLSATPTPVTVEQNTPPAPTAIGTAEESRKIPVLFTVNDSSVPGWKTYTNKTFGFSFNFPTDLELKAENVSYYSEFPDTAFYTYFIDLVKDKSTKLAIAMNIDGSGCGELARVIKTEQLVAGKVNITKSTYSFDGSSTQCYLYYSFKNKDNGFYMVGSVSDENKGSENDFDAIVKSFHFTKTEK